MHRRSPVCGPTPQSNVEAGWFSVAQSTADVHGAGNTHSPKPAPVSKQLPRTQSWSLRQPAPSTPGMQMAGDPTEDAFAAQEKLGGQCRYGSQAGTQMSGAVPVLKKSARHSSPDEH